MPRERRPAQPIPVAILGAQTEREEGATPPAPAPRSAEEWAALRDLSKLALKALGLRPWNDVKHPEPEDAVFGGKTLVLFPGEWYEAIPAGYELVSILGARRPFAPGDTPRDIRLGYLAYGLLV